MKLKHEDVFIPDNGDDPFINCKLERKQYAKVLTDIVSNYATGFVLAVNNEWGAGKTTFIKMWRQELTNREYKTLYYNAWENDFERDVLVALISELSEIQNKPEKEFKTVLKNVLPLAGKLLPSILKHLAVRYGGDEAIKDLAEAFGEYSEDQFKEVTDRYKDRKQSIKNFKSSLEQFVQVAGNGKPLVFFIDELDRCRPNYAVEVLEEIKHLFSVPGIVFVLSIDKEQLGHAVRGVYGSEQINADEYLRRFIDLEYSLPSPEMRKICNYLFDYFSFGEFIEHNQRRGTSSFQKDKDLFIEFSSLLFAGANIPFRQAEKMFALARVGLKSFGLNSHIFPPLFIFLIFLKVRERHLYNRIKSKHFKVQDLINEVEPILEKLENSDDSRFYIFQIIVELACSYHNYTSEGIYPYKQVTFSPEVQDDRYTVLTSRLGQDKGHQDLSASLDRLRYKVQPHSFNIKFLLQKIDLLDPLVEGVTT